MQKLGGFSKSPPFLLFSFALSSALLPHLLHSFLGFIPSSPVPQPQCPHFAHARAHFRVHSRTPAPPPISVFYLHPSPLYHNSLFINKQGVNVSPNPIPFTFPSPPLSRFSPTGYRKVPLFPTFPPYFSRHSPCLANCKISHRAGEGIFLKAFTPYALIYCALRPTGEEVKEKNEKHLTRAREGNPKNTPSSPCRLSPRPNIPSHTLQRLFSSCHIAFPSFATKPNHVAGRKENACTLTLTQHNVGHAHGFLTQNTTNSQFLHHNNTISLQFTWIYIYIYIYLCISSKSSSP